MNVDIKTILSNISKSKICLKRPLMVTSLLNLIVRKKDDQIKKDLLKNIISKYVDLSQKLEKQNSELIELNDQKNHFLGIAAHDLRNPIAVIQMYSEYLLNDKSSLTGYQEEFLGIIYDKSKFMLDLLNDLLDINKIESGRLDLNITENNYYDLVRDNIETSKIIAGQKQIVINLKFINEIPLFGFDKSQIEQVLNNLISNALKYSNPDTTVDVEVNLEGNYVLTKVIDQGQGIKKDELEKLFTPFYKTSAKTTAGEKSTGLGLSIVKKIINAHKGEIMVQSEYQKGSVFSFTLPVNILSC